MATEPLEFRLVFKHTTGKNPQPGTKPAVSEAIDFPQRLLQEEPALHLQEMVILS